MVGMRSCRSVFLLSLLLAVVGCREVYDARVAQRALEGKGLGGAVEADEVCLRDYSLRELVDFAMTNRPSVVAAALAVADARLALREIVADAPLLSRFPWNAPHLSASAGYSAQQVSQNDNALHWRTEGTASAALSLDILLYDFGRNEARASAQVERVIESELALVREGYAVFDEVAASYFTLLENDGLLEVAQTNEMEYVVHLRQAEEMLAAGEVPQVDVIDARAKLFKAKEQTIAASNRVMTAGAELMRALGIDISRGSRDTVFPSAGNSLSTLVRGFAKTAYGVEEAFADARTNAPAVAIGRTRLRAASRSVDLAVADLMPSVSASVGLGWTDPVWAWHWGVNAMQSVFQGFRKVTAVERAVVQMHAAATSVDEAEQQLSLVLAQQIAVRDNAGRAWETSKASVAAAREKLEMTKERYLAGEDSRVEFTDAVADYATELGTRISAFYSTQRAEAKLFATIGRLPEYKEESIHEK